MQPAQGEGAACLSLLSLAQFPGSCFPSGEFELMSQIPPVPSGILEGGLHVVSVGFTALEQGSQRVWGTSFPLLKIRQALGWPGQLCCFHFISGGSRTELELGRSKAQPVRRVGLALRVLCGDIRADFPGEVWKLGLCTDLGAWD